MYEHRTQRLVPWSAFVRRAIRHVWWATLLLATAVGVGTIGYHALAPLHWVDAFLNASMILSGMGPVDRMETTTAKLFAAFYALFSGLVFVGIVGIIAAPWVHRLAHWMHLDDDEAG